MKKALKTISNLLLALLVLVTSMGFTLNKHFCGGELQNVALNKNVELCAMCEQMVQKPACHKTDNEKTGCCENEKEDVKTQNFNLSQKVELQKDNLFFIAYTFTLLESIHSTQIELDGDYKEPSPPLIERDIPIEVQSFLL